MAITSELKKRFPASALELMKSNRRFANQDSAAREAHYARKQQLAVEVREAASLAARYEREFRETGRAESQRWQADAEAELADKKDELQELQDSPPESKTIFDDDKFLYFDKNTKRISWQSCIPEIKLKKNETEGSYLLKIREEVDATRKAIKSAENSPLRVVDAIERATSNIKKIAASGAPNVRGTLQTLEEADGRPRQGDLEWPEAHVDGHWYRDGFSLTVWLNKDLLIAKVTEEIKANAKSEGMSLVERASKVATLKAELLQLERLEEEAFRLASAYDPNLKRRKVSFEALLQIEPQTTASATTSEFN